MSLTVEQLINKLQVEVALNPEVAHKPVVLAQYDSESASKNGWEEATDTEFYCGKYLIIT